MECAHGTMKVDHMINTLTIQPSDFGGLLLDLGKEAR